MANPVVKLKEVVARVMATFRRVKDSDKSEERAFRRDPLQIQIRNLLWMLLLVVWAALFKVSYDFFVPHKASVSVGAHHKSKPSEKSQSLYPWAEGYSFGHDIVEPDVQEDRGLAAAIDERDLKITMGARFIKFSDIEVSLKGENGANVNVLLSVHYEVNSYPAEQRVLNIENQIKLREIILRVLADKDKNVFKDFSSINRVKKEILEQSGVLINVKDDKITDVLLSAAPTG